MPLREKLIKLNIIFSRNKTYILVYRLKLFNLSNETFTVTALL
jgi:hypothetical protein